MGTLIGPRPIRKILVANRGEIATRILTTCRELDLETFAVYTDNDISHTYNATHAIKLKSPASYMSVDEFVAIVRKHSIDAVHPGYGFLSESPEFAARLAAEAGCMVVGPGGENLSRTGDKLRARALARQCGVPVLPALATPTGRVEEVRRFVEGEGGSGYPVMIKAVDGGGGRGIRLVRTGEELEGCVRRAVEESPSRQVFAERAAVDGFRHVEVQVLGDGRGGVRHLWERECSIQRRYQKVVEIAPSTCEDRGLVGEIVEAALRVAREVKYASLGTFEFLVNPHTKEYYFLEINPRLQVEHTITESICSTDIVKAQLRLAQGASFEEAGLSHLSQDPENPPQQHSIQLRVIAEDPEKNYSLSIGKIQSFKFPSGVGVRVDTALVLGAPAIVTSDFDSVIAKVIVTAQTFHDAVSKARRALEDTHITGIHTNLDLLRVITSHPDFIAGRCDTTWLESRHQELLTSSRTFKAAREKRDPFHRLIRQQSNPSPGSLGGGLSGSSNNQLLFRKNDTFTLTLQPQQPQQPQQTHRITLSSIQQNTFPTLLRAQITHNNLPYTLSLSQASSTTAAATATLHSASQNHPSGNKNDPTHIILPLSGKLVEVLVDIGDHVEKDTPVCVIKQMKMEIEVRSHRAGRVTWVTEAEDDEDVAEGMLAAVVVEDAADSGKAKL